MRTSVPFSFTLFRAFRHTADGAASEGSGTDAIIFITRRVASSAIHNDTKHSGDIRRDARGHGEVRSRDWPRGARADQDANQGVLRLFDTLWRSAKQQYLPGVPGFARGAAGAKSQSARTGHPRGAGVALRRARAVHFRAQKLFLSGPAERLPNFTIRASVSDQGLAGGGGGWRAK